MTDISEGIQFRRNDVDPSQWPKLSCSQANQLALEVSDLRLDANRKILFQGNGQLTASGDMLFLTGDPSSSEKLRILANGNVGIGITAPTEKLEVVGKIKASQLDVSGTVKAATFQGDGSALNGKVSTAGDTITGSLAIQNSLTVSGNVGIGTTKPVSKLSIFSTQPDQSEGMIHLQVTEPFSGGHRPLTIAKPNSAKTARLDWTFEVLEGDSPGLSIFRVLRPNVTSPSFVMPLHLTWGGDVGIGTIPKQIFAGNDSSKVATPLTIKATGMAQGLITFEDADGKPTWHINQKFNGISGLNFVETGKPGGDGRLFIAVGGNVGIGKVNPACKLDVAGDLRADVIHSTGGFKFPDGTVQTTAIRIASGRVGFDKQSGVIINRRTVQLSGFNLNPTVIVALATIDADRNANLRINTFVENPTKNSFDICLSSWADTTIWSAQVMWIAFGS